MAVAGLLAAAGVLAIGACQAADQLDEAELPQAVPESLALVADDDERSTRQPGQRTDSAPISIGTPEAPFAPLPPLTEARAVQTPTGVTVAVIEERDGGWLISTPCQSIDFITRGTPIGRAHVVLDPGHGGAEPGAVSPGGLVEKDLNLDVVRRARDLLAEAGATVVLTRDGDHTMTAASRGLVAAAIEPALLVSVHHNGGAPAGSGGPGTIVFTKTDDPEATRFGGLFNETLQPVLEAEAEAARDRFRAWNETVETYDHALALHHQSAADRDAALVANGQIPPEATTTVPPPTSVGPTEPRIPRPVPPVNSTTTQAPTAETTVSVPETIAAPAPPEGPPVTWFQWAGSANAGVRSWVRPDGRDYLAVLRNAGDVPAVLAEFVYLTNPSEEALLADDAFLQRQAEALAISVTQFLSGQSGGTGFVADQFDDQPIGGSGGINSCVEPDLGQG